MEIKYLYSISGNHSVNIKIGEYHIIESPYTFKTFGPSDIEVTLVDRCFTEKTCTLYSMYSIHILSIDRNTTCWSCITIRNHFLSQIRGCRGYDCMIVGFTWSGVLDTTLYDKVC